ncbi:MAG: hypothetical protein SNF33_03125 [Candidatus Algichlamydia australiensis]|nr:hypothetical protein [Chlamydiales bacterium]
MRKLFFKFFLIFIGLGGTLAAQPVLIEGSAAYFRPTSSTLRDIYGGHWLNSGLKISGNLPFSQPFFKNLYLFGGFNYLDSEGNSIGGDNKTEIRIIPLSLGLDYIYEVSEGPHPIKLFLGAGLRYFFVRVKNEVTFVESRVTKSGMGGVVEGGALYYLDKSVFLRGFIDYSFRSLGIINTRAGVSGKGVEVGGLSIGGALGFEF